MSVPLQPRRSPRLPAAALESLLADVASEAAGDVAGPEPTRELTTLYALLRNASAPAEPGALPGESGVLAAFRELVPVQPQRRTPWQWVAQSKARLAVAASAAFLVMGGGVAAAATGSLPGPAQSAAHDVFNVVGVHVPDDQPGHSGDHGNGTSDTAPGHTGQHPGPAATGSPTAHPSHPAHPVTPTRPAHPAHPSTPPAAHHGTPGPTHPVPTPSRRPVAPPVAPPSGVHAHSNNAR